MSRDLQDIAKQVQAIYSDMDDATAEFAKKSGLTCPPGCGRCCDNPKVEASVLEMLPVANSVISHGEAESLLEKLADASASRCLMYEEDKTHQGNGKCSVYKERPTVCRLFGFAGRKNKYGKKELAVCFRHKETQPNKVTETQTKIEGDEINLPSFSEFSARVEDLEPFLGRERMNINKALRTAIEKLAFATEE